jgi:hypothetical protein
MHPVIAVHKRQPMTAAVGHYIVNAGIPGRRQAAVFLMNDMDSVILGCIAVANRTTAVGAAIVNQNQFKVPETLTKDTVHASV